MTRTHVLARFWWAFVAVGALAVALAIELPALTARGADHIDAPGSSSTSPASPGGDGRLDINDVYAFRSPENPDNTVLIMTVNPLAGVLSPTTFHPKAKYDFLIDNDGDAEEDLRFRIKFKKPDGSGVQRVKVKGPDVKEKGKTGEDIELGDDAMLRAGVFDDPFFFDLVAFEKVLAGTGTLPRNPDPAINGVDFLAGFNVSAIVLAGITHIKLPGSKRRTILDESHRSITHGCRQPSNQAHKTISRRGELAAPGSGGGFHHVCTPFKLLRARTSPLVASLHL